MSEENAVVTAADLPGFDNTPGDSARFGAELRSLSQALPLAGLGAMHVTVAPGKRAFPFHNHLGKDEMFVILSGSGTYRFGKAEYPVSAGDVCAAPRGGPERAHQIINSGNVPLVYLGISTQIDPDVIEYPDSGKFAALAVAPGKSFMDAHLRFVGRVEDTLEYWEGEE